MVKKIKINGDAVKSDIEDFLGQLLHELNNNEAQGRPESWLCVRVWRDGDQLCGCVEGAPTHCCSVSEFYKTPRHPLTLWGRNNNGPCDSQNADSNQESIRAEAGNTVDTVYDHFVKNWEDTEESNQCADQS